MKNLRVLTVLVAILAVVAVGVVLKSAQGVILPLVIAWLLSYLFGPVVRFLNRLRIPTFLATIVVVFLFLGVCGLTAIFMNSRIIDFSNAFPRYYDQLIDLGKTVTRSFDLPATFWSEIDWGRRAAAYLMKLSGSLVSLLSNLMMVIVFLVFILLGMPYFEYKLKRAFSTRNVDRVQHVTKTISYQIGRYLSMQFLISLITGVLVTAALWIIGVDFAITWGAFSFLLNFIPTIGSILASIPPILLALVQFYPALGPAILTAFLLLVIQMIMGNVITPKMMGDRLNLSPVVILVSLLFWGWLWGGVGALLSVPIAVTMKIVCENVDSLHVISIMMGSGRSYYKKEQARREAREVVS